MPNVPESAFPSDLLPQPCWRCHRVVVYAIRSPKHEHGARPVAIELVPAGVVGHVTIETSLIYCGGSICAYETNLPTRFRWHGPHCCELLDVAAKLCAVPGCWRRAEMASGNCADHAIGPARRPPVRR